MKLSSLARSKLMSHTSVANAKANVAVVLPEVVKAFNGRLRAAVVTDPEADKALYARYEFGKWPSLVFMQGEKKLGHITGIKDWGEYLQRASEMLNSAETVGAA